MTVDFDVDHSVKTILLRDITEDGEAKNICQTGTKQCSFNATKLIAKSGLEIILYDWDDNVVRQTMLGLIIKQNATKEDFEISLQKGQIIKVVLIKENSDSCNYVLVDHNDRDVPGEIVAVLDHHPTPKDKSSIPYYRNEKVSATACLIARDCEEELDKHDIELAAVATFVDTVSFHSSKTVRDDISWVNEMTTKYDFDYDEMYRDGLCLTELTDVEEIAFNGLKKAQYEDLSIHSSYVQIVDLEKNKDIIDGIIERLRTYREEENIDLFVFIVYS